VEALLGEEAYTGPEGMERATSRVLEALTPIEDPLRREVYMEDLAKQTGLPVALLERRLTALQQEAMRAKERAAARETAAGRSSPQPAAPGVKAAAETAPREREAMGAPALVELTAVAIALHDAEIGAQLLQRF